MKQFIDDPNSLDEGSKAMVCEAVEVLQVSDCKIFSFIFRLLSWHHRCSSSHNSLRGIPSTPSPIQHFAQALISRFQY